MATYGSEIGVEALNSHLTGGYGAATVPTTTAVATWLAEGYAALNLALAGAGYTTPVSSAADAYPLVQRLNNLYAAASAEGATNISTAGPGEETRSEKLWAQYRRELGELIAADLTLLGLTRLTTAAPRARLRSLPVRRYDGYAVYAEANSASEYAQDDD